MKVNRIATGVGLLLAGSLAAAQDEDGPGTTQTAEADGIRFTLNTNFEHQFETDVDGPGDVEVNRFHTGLGASVDLSDSLEMSLRFSYDLDSYDFNGATRLGGDPFDDIHTVGLGAIFAWEMTNDWTLFGGPVFQFAREEGADWDDSFIYGGVIGVTYRASSDLLIGGGIGVVSQLQDDARFFPIIVVDWHISDDLRLSSVTAASAGGRSGLELVWSLNEQWDVGFGGRYEFRRFRLDDEGIAADGVGQEERIPLWARVTYNVNDNLSLTVYAGIADNIDFELEDATGREPGDADAEVTGIIGASVRFEF